MKFYNIAFVDKNRYGYQQNRLCSTTDACPQMGNQTLVMCCLITQKCDASSQLLVYQREYDLTHQIGMMFQEHFVDSYWVEMKFSIKT